MKSIGTVSLKESVEYLRQCTDPSNRASVADQIGDLLERALQNPDGVDGDVLREAFHEMMTQAMNETNPEVKESLLHVLVTASSLARAKHEPVDPEPIAMALDGFKEAELEYALYILGFSRKPDYRPTIAGYREHPSPHIRAVAQQALRELQGK
jgi:hypothetical protein